ncbi:hypothetical protein CEXT_569001 [Caerostris extrusa]|uniref:Uncharacterized protein n=1 Tax=Caerostris extrusa TaxID=172846 RepID=A0AAV4Y4H2_CAEEX|nr:hypothetical protein CEXT_569001 [Caerostris extrusa]
MALSPAEKIADCWKLQFELNPNTSHSFTNNLIASETEKYFNCPHINYIQNVTATEVIKFIKSLNPKKASGIDNINANMIRFLPNKYLLVHSVRNTQHSRAHKARKGRTNATKAKKTDTDSDGFKLPPKHLTRKHPRGAATPVSTTPISISTNPKPNPTDLADDPVPPAPLARRPRIPPFFVQEIKRTPATSQPHRTQPSPCRVTEQSYANVVQPTPKVQRPHQAERANTIPAPPPTNPSAPLDANAISLFHALLPLMQDVNINFTILLQAVKNALPELKVTNDFNEKAIVLLAHYHELLRLKIQ